MGRGATCQDLAFECGSKIISKYLRNLRFLFHARAGACVSFACAAQHHVNTPVDPSLFCRLSLFHSSIILNRIRRNWNAGRPKKETKVERGGSEWGVQEEKALCYWGWINKIQGLSFYTTISQIFFFFFPLHCIHPIFSFHLNIIPLSLVSFFSFPSFLFIYTVILSYLYISQIR